MKHTKVKKWRRCHDQSKRPRKSRRIWSQASSGGLGTGANLFSKSWSAGVILEAAALKRALWKLLYIYPNVNVLSALLSRIRVGKRRTSWMMTSEFQISYAAAPDPEPMKPIHCSVCPQLFVSSRLPQLADSGPCSVSDMDCVKLSSLPLPLSIVFHTFDDVLPGVNAIHLIPALLGRQATDVLNGRIGTLHRGPIAGPRPGLVRVRPCLNVKDEIFPTCLSEAGQGGNPPDRWPSRCCHPCLGSGTWPCEWP